MQQSATDHSTGIAFQNLSVFLNYTFHEDKQFNIVFDSYLGTIDMDLITTGISASERMRRESLVSAARNIIMEKLQLGGPSMRLLEVCLFTRFAYYKFKSV